MKTSTIKFILSFDSGADGIRYIDDADSKYGSAEQEYAKRFDSKEEAEGFLEGKDYACSIVEITVAI